MPTQVEDELEKYAAKPASTDDELEKYAQKPAPKAGSLDEYLGKSIEESASGGGESGEKPGFFKRLGQSLGLPTTKEEVRAAAQPPSAAESILGPIVPAAKGAYEWGKRAIKNIGEGGKEELEAARNIKEGGPVLPNIGKAAYGVVHGGVGSIPFIGQPTETAGEDVLKENYPGAAGGLTGVAAQVLAPEIAERGIPAVGEATKGLREKTALALREQEGPRTNLIKPGVDALAKLGGAALGHLSTYAGFPTVGELGGYAVGPRIAEALIPKIPERLLYEKRGEALMERGEQQEKLDAENEAQLKEAEDARQKELADQEKLKEQDAQARQRRGTEQERLDREAAKKAALNPLAGLQTTAAPVGSAILPMIGEGTTNTATSARPGMKIPPLGPQPKPVPSKIVNPLEGEAVNPLEGEAVRTGSEGRGATWKNKAILEDAAKGDREAIRQAILRKLPLPPNVRYVMGDPDTARAVLNPREVTRFTPTGEPIRDKSNPFTEEPTARIPTIARTPKPGIIPKIGENVPRGTPLPFPGPMPESLPAAAVVGERPQLITERPAAKPAAEAPTLLEPRAPFGIKPLENAKPIMPEPVEAPPAEEEATPTEIKGVTEPARGKTGKAKPTPIEKRFTSEQIADAEGLLRQNAEAMQQGGKAGRQFVEDNPWESTTAAGRNVKKGERMAGRWMTVGGGRDIFPFLRENPKVNPGDILKALRNKDSAAYRNLVEKAVDFNQRNAPPPDEAYEFLRQLESNPDAEMEGIQQDVGGAEPTFNPAEIEEQAKPKAEKQTGALGLIQAIKEAKETPKGETGIIPGMEQDVAKQKEGAAKVSGENLTAEANKPKDISAAAGRMETLSPLFRGTEASPQREIFGGAQKVPLESSGEKPASWVIREKGTGKVITETFDENKVAALNRDKYEAVPIRQHLASLNAPATSTPQVPPTIEPVLKETGWEYKGKSPVGVHTIEEPGTNIKIQLWDRELNPDFVRRKIAEKEKQYGVVTNKEGVKGSTLATVERELNAAGEKLRKATADYRARKIGDIDFVAVQKKHAAILKRWEALRGEGSEELNF